jgi:hypothetical protein
MNSPFQLRAAILASVAIVSHLRIILVAAFMAVGTGSAIALATVFPWLHP